MGSDPSISGSLLPVHPPKVVASTPTAVVRGEGRGNYSLCAFRLASLGHDLIYLETNFFCESNNYKYTQSNLETS